MQPIKDYIVLDFLEWLKWREREYLFVDRLDYDLKYRQKIENYAKEYLENIKRVNSKKVLTHPEMQFKILLKSLIDSPEFGRFLGHIYYRVDIEDVIESFCKKLMYSYSIYDMKDALLCYYWKVFGYDKKELNEKYLVDSIKIYYSYYDDFRGKSYCKSEVTIIEQFLSYLDMKKVRINLKTIPRNYLRKLVHQYNKTEINDETIVNALKDRTNHKIFTILKGKLSNDKLLRYKELGYLYDRYNNDVQFKCLLLPLKGETHLEKFITQYWDDLDAASGNYLDIFVSKEDVQSSGYESFGKMSNLESLKEIELPCILIWDEYMCDAKVINIRGLDFSQLHASLQKIINLIKSGCNIDDIVNDMEIFIKECIEENKQYVVIQQQICDNHGMIIGMQTGEVDFQYLYLSEIQMAMNELEKLNLKPVLKKRSIGILYNLKDSIRKKSRKEQELCKDNFKKYIVGDDAELVINVLKEYYYIKQCLGIDDVKLEGTYETK